MVENRLAGTAISAASIAADEMVVMRREDRNCVPYIHPANGI
jgi:hypothetical protein